MRNKVAIMRDGHKKNCSN